MGSHTRTDFHGNPDEFPPVPGHTSLLAYIEQTRIYGLHCHDDANADGGCGWSGGSFRPDRWRDKHMSEAWAKHLEFVNAGGVIEHGKASNVTDRICDCVNCSIAHRMEQNAADPAA